MDLIQHAEFKPHWYLLGHIDNSTLGLIVLWAVRSHDIFSLGILASLFLV